MANRPRLMRELVMATIADQPDIELVGESRNASDLANMSNKCNPPPKPAPSGFYRTLLAITTDFSVQRGQAMSRSKQVAVLAEEE